MTQRINPKMLKPSTTDGYVLTTSSGKALWQPAPDPGAVLYDAKGDILIGSADNTRSRLAVGADGQVLTADSTAALGVRWATPAASGSSGSLTVQDENGNVATGVTQLDFQGAGVTATAGTGEVVVNIPGSTGGGGGTTVRDRRWTIPAGVTSIDEFNDDTLDPSWVQLDNTSAPAAKVTWVEDGDTLSAANVGGDSTGAIHTMMRPIGTAMVAGDAFVTHLELVANTRGNMAMAGLVLSNSGTAASGTQISSLLYIAGQYGLSWESWSFTNFAAGAFITGTNFTASGHPTHLRLVYLGSNTWRADLSPNGKSWATGATFTNAIVPTHVGVLSSSWGTSLRHAVAYEYLRRRSGVS